MTSAQINIAAGTAGNETGAVAGQFTVTLTAASSTDTVVAISVAGTAAAGSDFAAVPATVTIPAGATSATISIATIDDLNVEGTETVIATLTSITSGDPQITLATENTSATIELADNDSATVAFAAPTSTAIEAAGNHTVLVRLSLPAGGELTKPVTVNITNPAGGTAGAADYSLTTTTVTFAAGSHDGDTLPVVIAVVNDGTTEPDETLNLALAIGTDATGRTSLGTPAAHVVTISDDPITASLAGSVWADTNGNGVCDADEVKLQGITVKLTGTSNTGAAVTRTTTTDSQGVYRFTNLPGGTYSIQEQQPVAMMDGSGVARHDWRHSGGHGRRRSVHEHRLASRCERHQLQLPRSWPARAIRQRPAVHRLGPHTGQPGPQHRARCRTHRSRQREPVASRGNPNQ